MQAPQPDSIHNESVRMEGSEQAMTALSPQGQEVLTDFDSNRGEILTAVIDAENSSGLLEKPLSASENMGFKVDAVNQQSLDITFSPYLYQGQAVRVDVVGDDEDGSGKLSVRTSLVHQEQQASGSIKPAVDKAFRELGYKLVN